MRRVLTTLGIILQVSSVSAEEIKLRCGDDLLSIDTSAKSVHVGRVADSGWFSNREFQYTENDSGQRNYKLCTYHVTQYVRISADKIEFGDSAKVVERCGATYPLANAYGKDIGGDYSNAGDEASRDSLYIERATGLLFTSKNASGIQCQKVNGNAF